jgi:hypothetical protein
MFVLQLPPRERVPSHRWFVNPLAGRRGSGHLLLRLHCRQGQKTRLLLPHRHTRPRRLRHLRRGLHLRQQVSGRRSCLTPEEAINAAPSTTPTSSLSPACPPPLTPPSRSSTPGSTPPSSPLAPPPAPTPGSKISSPSSTTRSPRRPTSDPNPNLILIQHHPVPYIVWR